MPKRKLDAEIVRLADLKQDPHNANRGTSEGASLLSRSIEEFGFIDAGLIGGDNIIIGGNKRQLVASSQGMTDAYIIDITELPEDATFWLKRSDLNLSDPEDIKATRAALQLNRTFEVNMEWDEATIKQLHEQGIPLIDLFEGEPRISRLLAPPDGGQSPLDPQEEEYEIADSEEEYEPIDDPAEEAQSIYNVSEGDCFRVGPHAIICGDATDPDVIRALLAVSEMEQINGVITSPPYAQQRSMTYGGVSVSEYIPWFEKVQENLLSVMAPDGSFFLNIKEHMEDGQRSLYVKRLTLKMVDDWGWKFIDEFCWVKSPTPGKYPSNFKNGWEPIFQFALQPRKFKFRPNSVKTESMHIPEGTRRPGDWRKWVGKAKNMSIHAERELVPGFALPSNVLRGHKNDRARGHSAAFPVQIPEFFMRAYSDPGDIWLDPFIGSGTTIVSAHRNNRVGLGIELSPEHTAVSLRRFEDELGLKVEKI